MAHVILNALNEGFMDGYYGRDPNSEMDSVQDYTDGYLVGMGKRERALEADPGWEPPKYLGPQESLPFKRGDKIRIRKGTTIHNIHIGTRQAGKTYSVTLHDVHNGVPAYRESGWSGEIVPPKPPKAVWPGAGGYWSEVDINKL